MKKCKHLLKILKLGFETVIRRFIVGNVIFLLT